MKTEQNREALRRVRSLWKNKPYSNWFDVLFVFGVVILFIELIRPLATENLILSQFVVFLANILLIGLVWLSQRLRGERFRDLGLKEIPKSLKKVFRVFLWSLVVFVLALSAFVLAAKIGPLLGFSQLQADVSGYDYMKNNAFWFLLSLLGVYFVSSFGEEYVYRGFLMDRIMRAFKNEHIGKFMAIVLSAVVFGLAHYSWGIPGMIQTAVMGLVLSISYLLLNQRLSILVLAHAYMDTLLLGSVYFG